MAGDPTIRPLAGPFGAEILDFEIGADAANSSAAWHAALDRHQLLVFRDVELDADAQVALLSTLGPPLVENDSGRAYQFVSNAREDGILGRDGFSFHADHAFMPDPIEVISLYGLELPPGGTETRFVNALEAARALPSELRDRVGERRARHIIDPAAPSDSIRLASAPLGDDRPHSQHPIMFAEARPEEPVLFVSEQQTDRVEGMDDAESRALLEALFAHLYSGAFSYAHEWRPNDLLVWDNRALQHTRSAIPAGQRRTLRRVSVGGTPVIQFFRERGWWTTEASPSGS